MLFKYITLFEKNQLYPSGRQRAVHLLAMRLVTALLLPGVIVIDSSIQTSQARDLDGHESIFPAHGFLRSEGAVPLHDEERGLVDRIMEFVMGCFGISTTSDRVLNEIYLKNRWKDVALAKKWLKSDLDSLANLWWSRDSPRTSFFASPEFEAMSDIISRANAIGSVEDSIRIEDALHSRFALDHLKEFARKAIDSKNKVWQIHREAILSKVKETAGKQQEGTLR